MAGKQNTKKKSSNFFFFKNFQAKILKIMSLLADLIFHESFGRLEVSWSKASPAKGLSLLAINGKIFLASQLSIKSLLVNRFRFMS